MDKRIIVLFLACIAFTLVYAEVKMNPLNVGMAHEFGQMKNLTFLEGKAVGHDDEFAINRTIGWFSQSAVLDDRIRADLALGGLFFHFFPYNDGFDYAKVRISGVSIAQASLTYKIGDLDEPDFSLSIGMMPYKYSNSKNLGEYLFRSRPYPTTTINGSWDIVNSAFSKIKGFLLEKDLLDQSWKNDLLIYVSDELFPLNDLNLAWVTSFTFGPLELGAGVNFYKILSYRPSRTTPKSDYNSYFEYNGETYYGGHLYYSQVSKYFETQYNSFKTEYEKDSVAGNIAGMEKNKASMAVNNSKKQEWKTRSDQVKSINDADDERREKIKELKGDPKMARTVDSLEAAGTDREYYTYKGTLLMGRFSFDIGSLIGDIDDFKIYGEVSLLGWKDYPIFYKSKGERVPFILGFSIPTFGILDYLNVEVEYWENPYPISLRAALVDPTEPRVDYGSMSDIDLTKPYDDDNVKWSISAQRSIGKYIDISLQVANDHIRPIRYDFYPYSYETMLDLDAWYYVLRMQLSF